MTARKIKIESTECFCRFWIGMHQMRTVIQEDFKTALQEVDLLLSLVAPTAADKTGTAPFCSIFTLQLRHMHLAQENLLLSIIPKFRNSGQCWGLPATTMQKDERLPVRMYTLTKAIRVGLGDAMLDSLISNFSNSLVYHMPFIFELGFLLMATANLSLFCKWRHLIITRNVLDLTLCPLSCSCECHLCLIVVSFLQRM
jgi:hypothetical protein